MPSGVVGFHNCYLRSGVVVPKLPKLRIRLRKPGFLQPFCCFKRHRIHIFRFFYVDCTQNRNWCELPTIVLQGSVFEYYYKAILSIGYTPNLHLGYCKLSIPDCHKFLSHLTLCANTCNLSTCFPLFNFFEFPLIPRFAPLKLPFQRPPHLALWLLFLLQNLP
mgnify:FL=1